VAGCTYADKITSKSFSSHIWGLWAGFSTERMLATLCAGSFLQLPGCPFPAVRKSLCTPHASIATGVLRSVSGPHCYQIVRINLVRSKLRAD
jgi:hypothetical protein